MLYAHQQAMDIATNPNDERCRQGEINFMATEKFDLSQFFIVICSINSWWINKPQYDTLATQARLTPSAIDKQAAVYNKTFYSGFNYTHDWNEKWTTKTGLYGTLTQFENPTTRNYERKTEQSIGARTNTSFQFAKGKLNFGAEYQHGFSGFKVMRTIRSAGCFVNEMSRNHTYFFAQVNSITSSILPTIGASLNKSDIQFTRLSVVPNLNDERNFDAVFSPRIALLKKLNNNLSAYGTFSQGYSPPTLEELYPSNVVFNQQLNPEKGNNIEFGFRGAVLSNQIPLMLQPTTSI